MSDNQKEFHEHLPFTIPYTGSSAATAGHDLNDDAPQAAHPSAPQDKHKHSHPGTDPAVLKASSPDAPDPSAPRRDSLIAYSKVRFSTSENDAVRRSSAPHIVPDQPFRDQIPARFRSASNASGIAIINPAHASANPAHIHRHTATCALPPAMQQEEEVVYKTCEKCGKQRPLTDKESKSKYMPSQQFDYRGDAEEVQMNEAPKDKPRQQFDHRGDAEEVQMKEAPEDKPRAQAKHDGNAKGVQMNEAPEDKPRAQAKPDGGAKGFMPATTGRTRLTGHRCGPYCSKPCSIAAMVGQEIDEEEWQESISKLGISE